MTRLLIAALAIMAILMAPAATFAGKVSLPKDATKIKVKFDPALRIDSGRILEGDSIVIYLAEDIKIGGITIVEAGARGAAVATKVVKASKPGKPGKIALSFVEMNTKGSYKSKDGSTIKLAGVAGDDGGGRKVLSWLFIFGLFIKGGQGEIDTSLEYPATVGETIILESR